MFNTEIYNGKTKQLLDGHFIIDEYPEREHIHCVLKKLNKFTEGLSDEGTAYTVLQGGCYVSTRDHFFLAIGNLKHLNVVVMEIKSDFETVVKRLVLPLGHANDFTYNPKEDRIYIATGSTGKLANKIAILDLDKWDKAKTAADIYPYTLKKTNKMETPEYIEFDDVSKWQCSYDVVNDIYYVNDANHLKIYDKEWTMILARKNDFKDYYKGRGEITMQSSFCYNGKFVFLLFSKEDYSPLQITGIYLQTYNTSTGEVESISRYSPINSAEEPEFIDVIGDTAYMFSGQTYFRVSKINLNEEELYPPTDTKMIPKNTDMNHMLTGGIYYSPNAAHTATLKNIPVTEEFTLYVDVIGRDNLVHKVVDINGRTYQRNLESDGFSAWNLVDGCGKGSRYRRDKENTVNIVTLNKRGACFVTLCISSGANFYFINSSGEKAYVKTLTKQIPGVTVTRSGNTVTFKSTQKVTMFVWTMA